MEKFQANPVETTAMPEKPSSLRKAFACIRTIVIGTAAPRPFRLRLGILNCAIITRSHRVTPSAVDRHHGLVGRICRNGMPRVLLSAILLATGCSSIPVQKQRLLSKRSMQFSSLLAHSDTASLLGQIETGAAISSGAQASGCSSCR